MIVIFGKEDKYCEKVGNVNEEYIQKLYERDYLEGDSKK